MDKGAPGCSWMERPGAFRVAVSGVSFSKSVTLSKMERKIQISNRSFFNNVI